MRAVRLLLFVPVLNLKYSSILQLKLYFQIYSLPLLNLSIYFQLPQFLLDRILISCNVFPI